MVLQTSARILVLGASGLIGRFITDDLRAQGFHVIGIARAFSASQRMTAFDLELPILAMGAPALAQLIRDHAIDVIVNSACCRMARAATPAPCIAISSRSF